MRLTTDEKNFIVKKYAILGSPVRVQRAWRTKYKSKYAPNRSTITAIIKKFDRIIIHYHKRLIIKKYFNILNDPTLC
jgi:hypothetical protein